jgi:hypothetical protein
MHCFLSANVSEERMVFSGKFFFCQNLREAQLWNILRETRGRASDRVVHSLCWQGFRKLCWFRGVARNTAPPPGWCDLTTTSRPASPNFSSWHHAAVLAAGGRTGQQPVTSLPRPVCPSTDSPPHQAVAPGEQIRRSSAAAAAPHSYLSRSHVLQMWGFNAKELNYPPNQLHSSLFDKKLEGLDQLAQ